MSNTEIIEESDSDLVIRLDELQKRPQYIIPIENLIPNDYNPNVMAKKYMDALKSHIKMKGQVGDVVVRPFSPDYNFDTAPTLNDKFIIVDGYHRTKAIGEMGMVKIAVKIVDYTEAEAKIATIAFNKISGKMDDIIIRGVYHDMWQDHGSDITSMIMIEPFQELNNITKTEVDVEIVDDYVEEIDDSDDGVPANLGVVSPTVTETTTSTETTTTKTEGSLPASSSSNIPIQKLGKKEATVAIPYFIPESRYDLMTTCVSQYRSRNSIEDIGIAFCEIFENGKYAFELKAENDKLKAKINKIEEEKKERIAKAEARKIEKLKKEVEKNKEKKIAKEKSKE